MATDAQNRANQKYQKKRYRRFIIDIPRDTEPDLLQYIESKPNKRGYLIDLIKKDMLKSSHKSRTK